MRAHSVHKEPALCTLLIHHQFSRTALGIPAIGLLVSGAKWEDVIGRVRAMNINPVLIQSAKFFVAFPFTYHTFNGIRHLVRFDRPQLHACARGEVHFRLRDFAQHVDCLVLVVVSLLPSPFRALCRCVGLLC